MWVKVVNGIVFGGGLVAKDKKLPGGSCIPESIFSKDLGNSLVFRLNLSLYNLPLHTTVP